MKTLHNTLLAFWQEESGLTVVEYAVAGAVVIGATLAAFTGLGTAVNTRILALTTAI